MIKYQMYQAICQWLRKERIFCIDFERNIASKIDADIRITGMDVYPFVCTKNVINVKTIQHFGVRCGCASIYVEILTSFGVSEKILCV